MILQIIERLLCTGGTSSSYDDGDATMRSSNRTAPSDTVRDAAMARAQKKAPNDVQSTSGRRVVENSITSGNGEWACSVCTLHNPVSLFCTQHILF